MKDQTIDKITDLMSAMASIKMSLFQIIPNLVTGLIILIIGILFAYLAKWIGTLLIQGGVYLFPLNIRKQSFIKDNIQSAAETFGKLFFFVILFLFIVSSLKEIGLTVLSNWMIELGKNLPNFILAIFILFFGWKLKVYIQNWVNVGLGKTYASYSQAIGSFIAWIFFIFCFVIAIQEIGVEVSILTNFIGIIAASIFGGIALTISLGSRPTISNIISCFQIQKFIKIGDRVKFMEYEGTVEKIESAYIILDTPEKKITVPASIFEQNIIQIIKKSS